MSTTLKKITAKAKQMRKKHPNMKWQSLIKKASKEVKSPMKKKTAAKKRKPASRKVTVKKTIVRRTTSATIGEATTVSPLLKAAQRLRIEQILRWETKKLAATTKIEKKKIQKEITRLKAALRRINNMIKLESKK